MERTAMRDLYDRYIARCNEHRFDGLREFVAEDVNGPGEGLGAYVAGLEAVVAAFPDYRWTVERTVVEDDRTAVRLTGAGTHLGPFRVVAATGRRIVTQELAMYRVEHGRIAEVQGDLGSTVRDAIVSGAA